MGAAATRGSALLCLLGLLTHCGYPATVLDRRQGFGGKPITEQLPAVEDVPVKGFRASVGFIDNQGEPQSVTGELLAVGRQQLWLLVDTKRVPVNRSRVTKVGLELHPSHAGWLGAWFGLGTASALSHGVFALISVPIWVGSGIPSTITAALSNDLKVPLDRLDELPQFARYPAGMPTAMSGDDLRAPRPAPAPLPTAPQSGPEELVAPASQPAPRPAPRAPPPLPDDDEMDEPGMAPIP